MTFRVPSAIAPSLRQRLISPGGLHGFIAARTWKGRLYLISPFWDLMLSGGIGMVFLASMFLFFPNYMLVRSPMTDYLNDFAWTIGPLLNSPHLFSSYMLFYQHYGKKLRRFQKIPGIFLRYLFSGIILPIGLTVYLGYALYAGKGNYLGGAHIIMRIIIFWHYAKQCYGVALALSAIKGRRYSLRQRRFLLFNTYAATLAAAIFTLNYPYYSDTLSKHIAANLLTLPLNAEALYWIPPVLTALGILSFIVFVWDERAPVTGMLAYFSMYYMLFAIFAHPLWLFFFPMFHSLQYFMFIYAYKRGQLSAQHADMQAKERSRLITREIYWFYGMVFALGLLYMHIPPFIENALAGYWKHEFIRPLTVVVLIFVNIQHYFMDNVMWRKEHTEIYHYFVRRDPL